VGPSLEDVQAARRLGRAVGEGECVVFKKSKQPTNVQSQYISGLAGILVEHRSCGGCVLVRWRPSRLLRLGITKKVPFGSAIVLVRGLQSWRCESGGQLKDQLSGQRREREWHFSEHMWDHQRHENWTLMNLQASSNQLYGFCRVPFDLSTQGWMRC